MNCSRVTWKILVILYFGILFLFFINVALSQECRTFGFESIQDSGDLDLNNSVPPTQTQYKSGSNSVGMSAEPNQKSEIKSSIIFNDSIGSISFYWMKYGNFAGFFKLSLYYDDAKIAECPNINDWGGRSKYILHNNTNKTHELKWVLEHGGKEAVGKKPSVDAFIDDMELCRIRFAGEKEPPEPSIITVPVRDYRMLDPYSNSNIQAEINNISNMQNNGNYVIKKLILYPGNYNLINTLNLIKLKDISIECTNYEMGNRAILNICYTQTIINIENCTNIDIKGLNMANGDYGIYLNNSSECEISNSRITDFNMAGITLDNSSKNIIKENKIESNLEGSQGIYLAISSSNKLKKNNISVDREIYHFDNESKGNIILDNNRIGLIYCCNETYEICRTINGGIKKSHSSDTCIREINLNNGNNLTWQDNNA